MLDRITCCSCDSSKKVYSNYFSKTLKHNYRSTLSALCWIWSIPSAQWPNLPWFMLHADEHASFAPPTSTKLHHSCSPPHIIFLPPPSFYVGYIRLYWYLAMKNYCLFGGPFLLATASQLLKMARKTCSYSEKWFCWYLR